MCWVPLQCVLQWFLQTFKSAARDNRSKYSKISSIHYSMSASCIPESPQSHLKHLKHGAQVVLLIMEFKIVLKWIVSFEYKRFIWWRNMRNLIGVSVFSFNSNLIQVWSKSMQLSLFLRKYELSTNMFIWHINQTTNYLKTSWH